MKINFQKHFFHFIIMSSGVGNLSITIPPNSNQQTRRSKKSVERIYGPRADVNVELSGGRSRPMKEHYLLALNLDRHGENIAAHYRLMQQAPITESLFESTDTFTNAMKIAHTFNPNPRSDNRVLFAKGFAEFMLELEKVIQNRVLNREFVIQANEKNDDEKRALYMSMAASTTQIYSIGSKDIQQLTYRLTSLDDNFWANDKYKKLWNTDFRHLIEDTMRMIQQTFSPNPNLSYFGQLVPHLKDYIPERIRSAGRSPRGFIYKMDNNKDYLRVIFNILMIRFPTVDTEKSHELWKSFTIAITLNRIAEENEIAENTYLSNVTVDYTDNSLKNLFYYIPDQNRVVGIWPKQIRAKVGDGATTRLDINYNCQMIRSVLCKIRLSDRDKNLGSRINFSYLFTNLHDNIYTRIRKLDLFNFGRYDPWIRLYVSMTFFSKSNDRIFHVPWTIESLNSPFSNSSSSSGDPYDFSELLRVIIEIIEGNVSGRPGEEGKNEIIYVIIKFINEHPLSYYTSQYSDIMDELEEDDDEDSKSDRSVRPRLARTPQQVNKEPPNINGLLVGAPYAGTDHEKNFLHISMMNRFQFNDALFETPQRPRTYSCFMMSLIRAQMYMYVFEAGICKDVLVTNGQKPNMTCQGKLVEAVMDYSQCIQYPFLKKLEGEQYIQLFNNIKYSNQGKFLSGSRDEKENQFWELAADEIWLHLERFVEREINYNDMGDYGQVFADFFNVCISVYDIEYRGNRVAVITPYKKSPIELASDGEILMVHVVFDQGHVHAVNNLRNFIRSKKRSTEVRQYHYCPICDQKQTEELTCSKESALLHITNCVKNQEIFSTGFRKEEDLRVLTQHTQVYSTFKKVRGKNVMVKQCTQCHAEVNQLTFQCHVCTIQPKKLEMIPDEKIYVWDVEAAQMKDQFNLLKHECNCVYIRRVYTNGDIDLEQGRYFPSEIEFVDALMTEAEFQNSTFLAHNSGSYDIHFLLRIFERNEIEHTYTPSPTSKHKFIMVKLEERNVTFLDFIRFMPGSLRGIAESFQISVSKGDFPYKFNNGEHDSYVGCIPPLETQDDWWGLNEAKSQKQLNSFKEWYQSQELIYCNCIGTCSCDKQKWNFQEELKKYCQLDVIVLAKVVQAYRDKIRSFEPASTSDFPDSEIHWNIPKLDPFQFMTLPQITMQTLVHGYNKDSFDNYGFDGVCSFFQPDRTSRCPEALLWLRRCQDTDDVFILSRENSLREFYDFEIKMSFDGYAPQTNTVYIFFKCSFWGCPHCMPEYHETNAIIPERGISAKDVKEHYEVVMYHLTSQYKVKSIWQHQYNCAFYDPYYLRCIEQMKPSDCFYGGRTEVFKLYANASKWPDEEIHYYDVTSLYPSVYAHRKLPMGTPRYIIGYAVTKERLHPDHPDRYFGYARIKITPNTRDRIGLLPQRNLQTQRLSFPVEPMTGCWFTEEIYLAMQNGYIVEEIYEIYHWESNQISDQHLRGYVGYFLRIKQESEGWKKLGATSDNPSPEEQEEIANRLYHQNGGLARIRPDQVKLDPVMRALAKLYLNSLWGKWAQKASKECHTTIYGTQQFFQLWNDVTVERESCLFRDISPGVYKVNYKKKNPFIQPVAHGNIWLAASVTAWARITLHKQMLRIGAENIIYCDTDSIIFKWPKNGENLSGIGLGQWTDEYPKNVIQKVYALAPKLYALTLGNRQSEETYESFRAKGVQMTLQNQIKMSFQNILPLIQQTIENKSEEHTIEVDNFTIFTNSTNNHLPFGNLFSRYNKKKVRVIITKRTIEELEECNFEELAEINTYPPGYQFS